MFLVACKVEKAINYGPYRAIICKDMIKVLKNIFLIEIQVIYIFIVLIEMNS